MDEKDGVLGDGEGGKRRNAGQGGQWDGGGQDAAKLDPLAARLHVPLLLCARTSISSTSACT